METEQSYLDNTIVNVQQKPLLRNKSMQNVQNIQSNKNLYRDMQSSGQDEDYSLVKSTKA